jgi:DNA-binding MarR family transcriptional regulator
MCRNTWTGGASEDHVGDILRKRLLQSRFEGPVHEAMLNLIVAAGHVRDRLERVCAEHGITNGQYNVLRILKGAYPSGHARCEIARRLLERSPDVTRLIDRLETQGLVERTRSDEDKRLSLTRITRKGLKLVDEMKPELDREFVEIGRRLGAHDARELSRIAEALYGDELAADGEA